MNNPINGLKRFYSYAFKIISLTSQAWEKEFNIEIFYNFQKIYIILIILWYYYY